MKLENETMYWRGYFNEEPTEEEKEILSVACAEVIADFPIIKTVNEEYLHVPYPLRMEKLHFGAFLRWED